MEGVNREAVCNSVHSMIKLIIRISHTEPGKAKGFYMKLNEDLNKEIKAVADELAKATQAYDLRNEKSYLWFYLLQTFLLYTARCV